MGAPLGNHNARKHDTPSSPAGRQARAALDLAVEINGLRYLYSRIVQSSLSATDLPALLDTARVLNYLSTSITRFARLQITFSPPAQNDEAAEIGRLLTELRREMGVREIVGEPDCDPEPEEDDSPAEPFDPALHFPIFRPYPDPQPPTPPSTPSSSSLLTSSSPRITSSSPKEKCPPHTCRFDYRCVKGYECPDNYDPLPFSMSSLTPEDVAYFLAASDAYAAGLPPPPSPYDGRPASLPDEPLFNPDDWKPAPDPSPVGAAPVAARPDPAPSPSHQTLAVSETVRVFDHPAQIDPSPSGDDTDSPDSPGRELAPLAGDLPPIVGNLAPLAGPQPSHAESNFLLAGGACPRQGIIPRTPVVSIDFLNQNKTRLDPPQLSLHESRFTPHASLLFNQNKPPP